MTAKTVWFDVHPPFSFALTTKGELTVEWGQYVSPGVPDGPVIRMGIVIPAEEVKTLRRGLAATETIRETLAAKEPDQGAH
jgi:hypothetical protein